MATLTLDEIHHLSAAERIALIGQLWDSLGEADIALPDAQRAELQRRMAGFEEERAKGVSWDHVKAELTARAP